LSSTSVKRLEKFSLNALLITKLKTNPYDIHSEDINLLTLVDELILENQMRLNFNGLKIIPVNRNHDTVVSCDPILVKKCILNILENALTFSPSGSKIELNTYEKDKYLELEINDNGPGIPQIIIEKGAEMFTKGKYYNDKSTG
jgi:signal transduction histidine kinase